MKKEGTDPDNRFSKNIASLDGGVIYFDIDDNENIEFSKNVASLDGGVIYVGEH